MKKEVLNECIEHGNKYEFISYDDILDICDEKQKLVNFCIEELKRLESEGEIEFELDI